jgi:hypothetical protein
MSFFNIAYELSDKDEGLYFDNPLRDPCKTSEDKAINAFLELRPPVLVWELRLGFHSGWLELPNVGAPARATMGCFDIPAGIV